MSDSKEQVTPFLQNLRYAEEGLVQEVRNELFKIYVDNEGKLTRDMVMSLPEDSSIAASPEVRRILATAKTIRRMWQFQSEMGDPAAQLRVAAASNGDQQVGQQQTGGCDPWLSTDD